MLKICFNLRAAKDSCSLTHICHKDIVQMCIHKDNRQESEMSPHAQMQLLLCDLVAPENIEEMNA